MIVQFGSRQANNVLAPADEVPTSLTRTLKALGDPTRLLILRYLNSEPLTPNQSLPACGCALRRSSIT